MDVLTDALTTVRLTSTCWGRLELAAPWGMRHDGGGDGSMFYYMIRGGGWIEVEGTKEQIPLTAGDLVVMPLARRFVLRDDPATPARPMTEQLPRPEHETNGVHRRMPGAGVIEIGGGGRPSSVIFGVFHYDESDANPLITALPDVLHIRNEDGSTSAAIAGTLSLIAHETSEGGPGAQTVIKRLTDVLFIQIIRAYIARLGEEESKCCEAVGGNWLRALTVPQVADALELIHEHPEKNWSVASMASAVGMSRSSFATRFTTTVGEPPLTYLTRWRLVKAARAMRDDGAALSLAQIASAIGYESEAAFSKAFRRMFGQPPGAFRRSGQLNGTLRLEGVPHA